MMKTNIVFVFGPSTFGFTYIKSILENQSDFVVIDRGWPQLPWYHQKPNAVQERLVRLRNAYANRSKIFDIATWHLPYIESALEREPDLQLLYLHAPHDKSVRHLQWECAGRGPLLFDHWSEAPDVGWTYDPVLSRTFPKYVGLSVLQAMRKYVAEYDELALQLASRLQANMHVVHMDNLDAQVEQQRLFDFLSLPDVTTAYPNEITSVRGSSITELNSDVREAVGNESIARLMLDRPEDLVDNSVASRSFGHPPDMLPDAQDRGVQESTAMAARSADGVVMEQYFGPESNGNASSVNASETEDIFETYVTRKISVMASSVYSPRRCVVLVPFGSFIHQDCELSLKVLERRGYEVRRVAGYSAIDQGRNQMATDALRQGFQETLWIDSDIGFEPDDVEKLRRHNLPICCGIYPQKGRRELACFVPHSTPKIVFGKDGGLVEILYAGAGFLHIRREAYQIIQQRLKLPVCNERFGTAMIPFFQPLIREHDDAQWYLAEDYAFCERARQCGLIVYADTSIRLWHVGNHRYSWENAGMDFPRYDSFTLQVHKDPDLAKAGPQRS